MKSIVILISGRGSNMEAIVRTAIPGTRISAVISNRPDAGGLEFAAEQGIATRVIDHKTFPDRGSFDHALAETINEYRPDLIILAGFMRILTAGFVQRFEGRLLNIHPSLLPAFPGLHTHRRAIETGVRVHGATVHFVTDTLDNGPIIIQGVVPVHPDDNEQTLAARVLQAEHLIFPQAVRWFVEGKLSLNEDGRIGLNGIKTPEQAYIAPMPDPQS